MSIDPSIRSTTAAKWSDAHENAVLRRMLEVERVDMASLRMVEDAIESIPSPALGALRVASLLRKLQGVLAQ